MSGTITVLLTISATPAAAVSIVPSFEKLSADEEAVFRAAIGYWEATVLDPFALTLAVRKTSIPGEILARTTDFIEGVDSRPVSATIELDDRSDGFGWYVDASPGDHSEFLPGVNASHFKAPLGTDLSLLFDFYSIVNHEIAHALGFTARYSAFAAHLMTTPDGSRYYEHGALKVPFALTGTHISDGHYLYDLMGPTIGVGERRLPSYIDVLLLSDAFGYDAALPPPPSSVPEPSAALLLLSAVAWRAARRARRRARR